MRPGSCCLALVGLIWLTSLATAEDVKFPDTTAGQRANAFLAMLNTNSGDKAKAFVHEHVAESALKTRPLEQRLQVYEQLHDDLAPLTLTKIVAANETSIKALIKADGNGETMSFNFEFEGKPPHKLLSVRIQPAADANLPPGKLSEAQIIDALGKHLDKLTAEERFSGVVLLVKDGKPLFHKAYGYASLRYQVPNQLDTKFCLGSMNKMFTGVAICQLAQQGKLAFDDLIIKHLPDYPNKAVAEKVTIHHLLTHTSGLNHYWNEKFNARLAKLRTVKDFLPLFADDAPLFEPGAKMHYSNAGFIVLGLIVEKVSGQTYYDYIQEHICKPAGMTGTDCYETDQIVPNLATGHATRGKAAGTGKWRENWYLHAVKGGPAGGGYSTAEDLLRFGQALLGHKLLDSKHTTLVNTGKVTMGPNAKYAYGFGDMNANGERHVGHSGGAPGINADFRLYLGSNYTAIVLANFDNTASPVARFIETLITQK